MGARYGTTSRERLAGCEPDLQRVLNRAEGLFPWDVTILEGHRTPDRQFELFKQGRSLIGDKWIVTKSSKVVTNIDGFEKKGNHNYSPSRAVDVAPYPVDWSDAGRWKFDVIAGVIIAAAKLENVKIRWGGDWDGDGSRADHNLIDLPHFEVVK